MKRRHMLQAAAAAPWLALAQRLQAAPGAPLPIFDAHVHYSHDAVTLVPPAQAVALLRAAGLKGAFVSSSDDDGTQLLAAAAPDLIVPELRPYRTRADTGTWVREPEVIRYMEARLAKYRYAGVGEFHLFGDDAELPVPRRLVALARERNLVLHAHSDATAVQALFRQWPEARILWAHAGFDRPQAVQEMLQRFPRLWCDLAYRSDQATVTSTATQVDPEWRALFEAFPDRLMVGSDTFTPERWHFIGPHAEFSRGWLATLAPALAERIAWRNAEALLRPAAGRA